MSIATHTARTVTRSVATGKSKEKTPGSLIFLLAASVAMRGAINGSAGIP